MLSHVGGSVNPICFDDQGERGKAFYQMEIIYFSSKGRRSNSKWRESKSYNPCKHPFISIIPLYNFPPPTLPPHSGYPSSLKPIQYHSNDFYNQSSLHNSPYNTSKEVSNGNRGCCCIDHDPLLLLLAIWKDYGEKLMRHSSWSSLL
jgi:hypothetical protein